MTFLEAVAIYNDGRCDAISRKKKDGTFLYFKGDDDNAGLLSPYYSCKDKKPIRVGIRLTPIAILANDWGVVNLRESYEVITTTIHNKDSQTAIPEGKFKISAVNNESSD